MRTVIALSLLGFLALPACGGQSEEVGIGIDESMVCPSPAWYCAAVGGWGFTMAMSSCTQTSMSTKYGSHGIASEVATCSGAKSLGLSLTPYSGTTNDHGTWGSCNNTSGKYSWTISIPSGVTKCKSGQSFLHENYEGSGRSHYSSLRLEDHLVASSGCSYGYVQCFMSDDTWYGCSSSSWSCTSDDECDGMVCVNGCCG